MIFASTLCKQHSYSSSKDIQSSTYSITDEDGFFVVGYEYCDFGETEKIGESTFYNKICYTGAVYDGMTGLHYLNARYYNPDEAVFLSQDSYRGDKTDSTTWNLYAYCAGNPVKYVDPSGHYVETIYDAYSLGDSLVELIKEPSLENAWWAAFDVASLIAPIPAGGKVARATDDAVDAVRAGNKVVDGVKGAKKVKVKPKVSKKVTRVKKASKTPKIKSKKGSVKKKNAKTKGKKSVKAKSGHKPYGTYEKADYHGKKKNSVKNKAPNNGQAALDNSVSIGAIPHEELELVTVKLLYLTKQQKEFFMVMCVLGKNYLNL